MITFYIDVLTPCLVEVETGKIVDTEVIRVKKKSFLSTFNKKTGWYINWAKMPEGVEVYALGNQAGILGSSCAEMKA